MCYFPCMATCVVMCGSDENYFGQCFPHNTCVSHIMRQSDIFGFQFSRLSNQTILIRYQVWFQNIKITFSMKLDQINVFK